MNEERSIVRFHIVTDSRSLGLRVWVGDSWSGGQELFGKFNGSRDLAAVSCLGPRVAASWTCYPVYHRIERDKVESADILSSPARQGRRHSPIHGSIYPT